MIEWYSNLHLSQQVFLPVLLFIAALTVRMIWTAERRAKKKQDLGESTVSMTSWQPPVYYCKTKGCKNVVNYRKLTGGLCSMCHVSLSSPELPTGERDNG